MTPAITPELRERADLFYIVDLRHEWDKNPYISFWRPDDAGYCYPLGWAGKYTAERVAERASYYTHKEWTCPKGPGRLFTRFPVRCADVEALVAELGGPPDTKGRGRVDGNTGPVLRMSGAMRNRLRRLRYVPRAISLDAPPATPLATGEAENRKVLSGQNVSLSLLQGQSANGGAPKGEPATGFADAVTPSSNPIPHGKRDGGGA